MSATQQDGELPVELTEYVKSIRNVTFKLANSTSILTMSLTRDREQFDSFYCGLYCHIETPDKSDGPFFSLDNFWHSNDNDSLARIRLVKERQGFRLTLPSGSIRPIDAQEQDRLLDLLSHLRGIELHYTPDLFGFLKKDGSDKPRIIKQPFPTPLKKHAEGILYA